MTLDKLTQTSYKKLINNHLKKQIDEIYFKNKNLFDNLLINNEYHHLPFKNNALEQLYIGLITVQFLCDGIFDISYGPNLPLLSAIYAKSSKKYITNEDFDQIPIRNRIQKEINEFNSTTKIRKDNFFSRFRLDLEECMFIAIGPHQKNKIKMSQSTLQTFRYSKPYSAKKLINTTKKAGFIYIPCDCENSFEEKIENLIKEYSVKQTKPLLIINEDSNPVGLIDDSYL